MQQDNTGTKYPALFVLNGPSQFLQCFTVTLSIHRLTYGQEVDQEISPSVLIAETISKDGPRSETVVVSRRMNVLDDKWPYDTREQIWSKPHSKF